MAEKTDIEKLGELIAANAVRVDRGAPDAQDVGFFGIILHPDTDLTALKLRNAIVRAEKGVNSSLTVEDLLNEQGVSYTTLGIWLGDPGLGLAFIGLGAALELWDVHLPINASVTDEELAQRMMNQGFVKLRVGPDSILRA